MSGQGACFLPLSTLESCSIFLRLTRVPQNGQYSMISMTITPLRSGIPSITTRPRATPKLTTRDPTASNFWANSISRLIRSQHSPAAGIGTSFLASSFAAVHPSHPETQRTQHAQSNSRTGTLCFCQTTGSISQATRPARHRVRSQACSVVLPVRGTAAGRWRKEWPG